MLVIEDDRDIATAARLRLDAAGYQVLLAQNGAQGLALAVHRHPYVVLLDLDLAGTNGERTLTALRQQRETTDIPIVLLSADRGVHRQALAMGVRHYLDKPYNPQNLLETVRSALTYSIVRQQSQTRSPRQDRTKNMQHDVTKIQRALTTHLGAHDTRTKHRNHKRIAKRTTAL